MKAGIAQRLDRLARNLVPVGLTTLLLLVTLVPSRLPGFAQVVPTLGLMSVYYWAIHRPDLLPAWMALLLGLLHDVLTGMPLGVGALAFVMLHGVVQNQRKLLVGKAFAVAWWGFLIVGGGALLLMWLLTSVLAGAMVRPEPVIFQYLASAAFYPVLGWLLGRTHGALLRDA